MDQNINDDNESYSKDMTTIPTMSMMDNHVMTI